MKDRLRELRSGDERIISSIMLPIERGRERLRGFNYGNALIGAAAGCYFGVGIPETIVPFALQGRMSSEVIFSFADNVADYTSLLGAALGFVKRDTLAPYVKESFRETLGSLFRRSPRG